MAETLKGLGVRWGVNGITYSGFAAGATGKTQSITLNRTSEKAEIKNESGECVGQIFYNEKKTLSLSVVPSAATIADARTAADSFVPAPGTTITVTDGQGATIDGTHSGAYNLTSATLRLTNEGATIIDMEMEQYVANNVGTTIT